MMDNLETILARAPDWMKYVSQLLVPTIGHILRWVGIYYAVLCILAIWVVLWRFCKVKFGKRIRPNGDLGILITGATSGFGLALAKMFYNLGFTVLATYFNDREVGYTELQELGSHPIKSNGQPNFRRPYLFLIKMDVRSSDSIEDCGRQVDLLLDQHDVRLYSLINNAGIALNMPFQVMDRNLIMNIMSTNVTGSMLVARQFFMRIIKDKGKVICVSSGTHPYPGPMNEIYGASKAAIYHFSRALHGAIEGYGASSHCMVPGNLITASNICYGNLRSLNNLEKNLTAEEQNFHQDLIVECRNAIRIMVAKKLKRSGDNLDEVAAIFDFKPKDLEVGDETDRKRGGIWAKIFYLPLTVLSGQTRTCDGALEAFKQVVCVKKPPLTLYPGNALYSYLIGPMVELNPVWLNYLWGKHIIGSIMRGETD